MVTMVSVRTLPVLSVTVPVMPPSVCCAWAQGIRRNGVQRDNAVRRATSAILLSMSDLVQVFKCSTGQPPMRFQRTLSAETVCSDGHTARQLTESTRVGRRMKAFVLVKISLAPIRYFYRGGEVRRQA